MTMTKMTTLLSIRKLVLLVLIVSSCIVDVSCKKKKKAHHHKDDTTSGNTGGSQPIITLEELDTFIDQATQYIVRVSHTAQQDSLFPGRFTYEQNLKEPLDLSDGYWNEDNLQEDYNLLRHNGAIYSLGLSYQRKPNEETKEAMQRGISYLKNDALHPVPNMEDPNKAPYPDLLAAWEKTSFDDPHAKPQVAKLGGAGLALIALIHLEYIEPGTTSISTLRQIGNFIQFMQHSENGSFTCKYSYNHGKNDDWNSLYYPGEAALGLVLLAELDVEQQGQWLVVATKALLYLEGLRRTQPLEDIEPDHWALLATAKLLPLLEEYDSDYEYWLVYNHAVRVATSLVDMITISGLGKHQGCMSYDRRTCPTATRLEGLMASLTFIRDSEMYVGDEEQIAQPLRERIEESIEYGVKFLLDSQELSTTNQMNGGIPERYPIKDAEQEANVRVDYVQHSVSAIIAYERYVLEKKRGTKLVRQGMKKLKNIRDKVADQIHSPHQHKNRGNAVVVDAGMNYIVLGLLFVAILAVVVIVYKPVVQGQRRRRGNKRND